MTRVLNRLAASTLLWALACSPSPKQALVEPAPAAPAVADQPKARATTDDPKEVLDRIAAGDVAWLDARVHRSVKETTRGEWLKVSWEGLELRYGRFDRILDLRTGSARTRVSEFRLAFAHANVGATVALSPNDRILQVKLDDWWTPPKYAEPARFREQDVTIGTDPWQLPATITMPRGDGPFPGVVLVHGSGPSDRDETVGPNKVFRDLAYGLASRGVAVLRYVKRTKAHGAAMLDDEVARTFTMDDETVDDAVIALASLRTHEAIDPKRTFAIGHSQGGYMMPRIVKADAKLAGAVVLAGSTRPLHEIIPKQLAYIAEQQGRDLVDAELQMIEAAEKIAKLDPKKPPGPDERFLGGSRAAYWLDLHDYDPVKLAKRSKTPLLILQGGRDYQVTEADDFVRWQRALRKRKHVKLKVYPAMNHLFIAGEGPSSPKTTLQPGHVALEVIEDIVAWIAEH